MLDIVKRQPPQQLTETMMADSYAIANRSSYRGQRDSFSFPTSRISAAKLGFQPLGINCWGTHIAIAAYFEPAVLVAEMRMREGSVLLHNIRWIRDTIADGTRVRMFPDLYEAGGANRMQTCLIYSPERLGLVRNGERAIHMIELRQGAWHHTEKIELPPHHNMWMVHAATLGRNGELLTIESEADLECGRWALYVYDSLYRLIKTEEVPAWRYGIALKSDGSVMTIADYRANVNGIFVDGEQRVLDIVGNGIALLDDGQSGALVTTYGQSRTGPFNGVPGMLRHIPPRWLP